MITLVKGKSWSVVVEGDESEHLAPTLTAALTAATGDPANTAWIRTLQEEVESTFLPPFNLSRAVAALLHRLRRSQGDTSSARGGPTPPP